MSDSRKHLDNHHVAPSAQWSGRVFIIASLAAAYFAATRVSLALVSPQFGLAAFWPAAGVLAGGLAIMPRRDGAWLLALIFAIVLVPSYLAGTPFSRALVFASADCLEGAAFLAFYHFGRWEPRLRTPRDLGHFLAAGASACLVAGAAGAAALPLVGDAPCGMTTWLFWALADFIGIFAVTPVIFFVRKPPASRRISLEGGLALAGGIGATAVAFLTPYHASWTQVAPLAIACPFLLWCATRGSIFANALMTLAITTLAILASTYDLGPFAGPWPLTDRILATQFFLLRACGASVLLAILFEDRRSRELQLRTLIDTVPVGLILTEGTSGRLIGGNRQVETLIGHNFLSSADLSGLGQLHALDQNDERVDPDRFPWARLACAEDEDRAMDVNYRRKDGTFTWLRLMGRKVRDADGATVGNVFAVVNIDEEKKAWKRVQTKVDKLQVRLSQASQASAMGSLASAIAHELNQPLAAVVNYLQAAHRITTTHAQDLPPDLSFAVLAAEDCAMRAGEIIRRLRRMLSRGEVETERTKVLRLVEESIALACTATAGAPASFDLDVDPDLHVPVDAIQIQQVLINLVQNALEAMEGCARRAITISARRNGQVAEIVIRDSGPGFADSVRANLFQPFVSTKASGMGVGLSICRTIVERHGGKISASDGMPTSLVITLPISAEVQLAA